MSLAYRPSTSSWMNSRSGLAAVPVAKYTWPESVPSSGVAKLAVPTWEAAGQLAGAAEPTASSASVHWASVPKAAGFIEVPRGSRMAVAMTWDWRRGSSAAGTVTEALSEDGVPASGEPKLKPRPGLNGTWAQSFGVNAVNWPLGAEDSYELARPAPRAIPQLVGFVMKAAVPLLTSPSRVSEIAWIVIGTGSRPSS